MRPKTNSSGPVEVTPRTRSVVRLTADEWVVLRKMLRDGASLGRVLRVYPTRRNKDGSHLANLFDRGLIRPVNPAVSNAPLTAVWVLTDAGRCAAEYGEYMAEHFRTRVALPDQPAEYRPPHAEAVGGTPLTVNQMLGVIRNAIGRCRAGEAETYEELMAEAEGWDERLRELDRSAREVE